MVAMTATSSGFGEGYRMMERISALLDGELDHVESVHQIERLKSDGELRGAWDTYHLIGDALRGHLSRDLCARVSARLAAEPTVFAPQRRAPESKRLRRWALSAAAGATAAVLVIWTAVPMLQPDPQVARAPSAPAAPAATSVGAQMANSEQFAEPADTSEPAAGVANYLLAHQRFSATSAMQGVAPYVRTVSAEREDRQ